MKTSLGRAAIGSMLLMALAAPDAGAGTAVALASESGRTLTLVNFYTDPGRRPRVSSAEVREPMGVALTPDGEFAVAYEPSSQRLHAVGQERLTWAMDARAPAAGGWIGARSGRLFNLQRDGSQLVDAAVGAVIDPGPAVEDLDVVDCASSDGLGLAYCLTQGRFLLMFSLDGELVDQVASPSGFAIEPGFDGRLVIAAADRVMLLDPADERFLEMVDDISVEGISTDLASGLLLVHASPHEMELRDLASLQLLRRITLTGEPVRQAVLMNGGVGMLLMREDGLEVTDLAGGSIHATHLDGEMAVGRWTEPLDPFGIDAASQGSVDDVSAKLDARLDVAVSSRASQASVDQANARLDVAVSSRASQSSVDQANAMLDAAISSRASQESVDAIAARVDDANARLDVAVSSRASQASVDQANARLDVAASSRASQASVDAIASDVSLANARLDVAVSSRASQASVDQANAMLDVAMSSRASQASVDGVAVEVDGVSSQVDAVGTDVGAVASDVDAAATDLAALRGLVDVSSSSRASQSSLDGVASRVARVDGLVDVSVSSRAAQDSVDAIAADLAAATDDAAEAHARLLEALATTSRRGIENALLSGVVEPMFLIPGGAGADPALDGATCPSLLPAGHAGVHVDGQFETVRCVTRRAIDAMAAIGEDTRSAERSFEDGEVERQRSDYRAAVAGYARALESLSRGR